MPDFSSGSTSNDLLRTELGFDGVVVAGATARSVARFATTSTGCSDTGYSA